MKRVLSLMLLVATSAAADEVILNDGTRLDGQLSRSGSTLVLTSADGSTRQLDESQIKSIQKTATAVPAASELASLRRQLASTTQPGLAVGRLRDFINRHRATPEATNAQTDLDIWQHRADAGLVQAGSEWVTPGQYAVIQSKSGPAVQRILSLLANGKTIEAKKALENALRTWPNDSRVQFLNGVMLYRAKQLAPARQAFDSAVAGDPTNAAAHNNLAVILWQMHQQPGALAEYERALVSDIPNKAILDNAAEALHNLPLAVASNAIARRLATRFELLDSRLRDSMAKEGLHRYGSEWVDDDTFSQRTKKDSAARETIAGYPSKVHSLQRRLQEIDEQISLDVQMMHDIDQITTQVQPDGSILNLQRPQRYADLGTEVAQLNIEKIMKSKELRTLPKQLADAQANPGPRWNRPQLLIGEESLAAAATPPAALGEGTTRP